MTTTVESIFGDGRMVDGFFLNNQLTDFSFYAARTTTARRRPTPWRRGKRPRSSMAPAIVLDKQRAVRRRRGLARRAGDPRL